MDHQDLKVVNIGNGKKSQPVKKIVPKNHVDMHKIKIENEQENFSIQTIPRKLSNQITQCRVNNKITQKEKAKRKQDGKGKGKRRKRSKEKIKPPRLLSLGGFGADRGLSRL